MRAVFETLARTPEPPTRDETLAAWRRVLAGAVELGVLDAAEALLDLQDVASRYALRAALDRAEERLESLLQKRSDLQARVDGLRKRLLAEMPPPPAEK